MAERTTVYEFTANYEDLFRALVEIDDEIQKSKKSVKELQDAYKKGEITQEDYVKGTADLTREIKNNTNERKQLNKEIDTNIAKEKEADGSVNSLRISVADMTKQYYALSDAERKGANGDELRTKINAQKDAIGEAEQSLGDFRGQVGNYENSIANTIGLNSKMGQSFMQLANSTDGVKGAMNAGAVATKNLGLQLLKLLANPIVAIVAAIVAVFMAFRAAVTSNEKQMMQLNAVFAPFKRIVDIAMKALQEFADVIITVIEYTSKLVSSMLEWGESLPSWLGGDAIKEHNKQMKEAVELADAQNALTLANRAFVVEDARMQAEIAELRAKSRDKELLTADERKSALNEALVLEKKRLTQERELVAEELRIKQALADRNESDTNVLDELAQLKAKLFGLDKEYSEFQRGQSRERNALNTELKAEQKAIADAAKKILEDRYSETIKVEEMILKLREDSAEKSIAVAELQSRKEIDAIRKTLKETTDKTTRAALNQQIKLSEEQLQIDIQNIKDKYGEEQFKKDIDAESKRIQALLEINSKDIQAQGALKAQQIELNRKKELEEAKKTGADIVLINARYDKQIADAELSTKKATILAKKQAEEEYLKGLLLKAQLGTDEQSIAEATAAAELTAAQSKHDSLLSLDADAKAALFESDQAYTNAVLESELAIQNAKLKTTQVQKTAAQNQMEQTMIEFEIAQEVFSGLSGMINTFAENNEELAEFAKLLALFEIGLNTAKAFAAIPAMAAAGDPYTYAFRVAAAIGTALGAVGQAYSVLNKQKQPKAPKFHTGGVVGGAGEVSATLLSNESVMNRASTQMFAPALSAMNMIGGGKPIVVENYQAANQGIEFFAAAFRAAIKDLPQPRVAVYDFIEAQDKVTTIDNFSSIS